MITFGVTTPREWVYVRQLDPRLWPFKPVASSMLYFSSNKPYLSLFFVHGFISNCLPGLQKQYANLGESMGRIQDAVHIIWPVGLHASGLISFARTQSGCA